MIYYRILSVDNQKHTCVIRYGSSALPESKISVIEGDTANRPVRAQTDVSFDLPIPMPTPEELTKIIFRMAPVQWLKFTELADRDNSTSMAALISSVGVDVSEQAKTVAEEITYSLQYIDNDLNQYIYSYKGQNSGEYAIAEEKSRAFVRANYPAGAIPSSVSSLALATGISDREAADLIISKADAWDLVAADIRFNRLSYKKQVRGATTAIAVQQVMARWDAFFKTLPSQAW